MKLKTDLHLSLCNPMDDTVHGILQARILEWWPFSSPGDLYNIEIKPRSPALQADSLPAERGGKPDSALLKVFTQECVVKSLWTSEVAQSCPTLCDPMNCSLPGSSIHVIFQTKVWEWVEFPSPGDLPDPGIKPRSPALQAGALPSELPGKPQVKRLYFFSNLQLW